MNALGYLDRMLEPVTKVMPVEFAQQLVDLRADETLRTRMELLRTKANEGLLTEEEADEYREVVEAIDLISLLQAKARSVLSHRVD